MPNISSLQLPDTSTRLGRLRRVSPTSWRRRTVFCSNCPSSGEESSIEHSFLANSTINPVASVYRSSRKAENAPGTNSKNSAPGQSCTLRSCRGRLQRALKSEEHTMPHNVSCVKPVSLLIAATLNGSGSQGAQYSTCRAAPAMVRKASNP